MFTTLFKSLLLGFFISAPLGPVAIYMLQKSIQKGHMGGYISSLGTTLIDTIYCSVCILALGFAQNLIDSNRELFLIAGGTLVAIVGLNMLLNDPFRKKDKVFKVEKKMEQKKQDIGYDEHIAQSYEEFNSEKPVISVADPVKASLLSLSNPGAIFVSFGLMSLLGIEANVSSTWSAAPIVLCCSAGSTCYWFFFTWLMSYLGSKLKLNILVWVNRVCGAFVGIFGIVLLFQGIYDVAILGKTLFNF